MKLTHIRVKDFRSFVGEHKFDVASGVNYYVGPNNCGKSNLIRALELALDPDARYAPEADRPVRTGALGAPPTTRITLTFQAGASGPEKTLLQRAENYELAVRRARKASTTGGIKTYAGEQELRLATSFGAGGARQTTFQAKGFGAASLPLDSEEHQKLEAQFRSVLRFAVVHSGEDLASLLQGKFREILQLVIADHLGAEMSAAEQARIQYLESLKAQLLEPLRKRVLARVGDMFPEITLVDLVPDVPRVTDTLSSVEVRLGDLATTGLASKGTGVRGAVLISMLQLERLFVLEPLNAWAPTFNHLSRLSAAPKHHLAAPALAARLLGMNASALLRGEGKQVVQRDGTLLGALFESLSTLVVRVCAQAAEARVLHFRSRSGE